MKKILYFSALVMALASCTSQIDDLRPLNSNENIARNSKRTISEAIDIAKEASSLIATNSRSYANIDEQDVIVIQSSRSRDSNADTLMYVVNNADNDGFTIIAAPTNVTPIIAISENGTFESDETSSNNGFQYALNAAKIYVENESSISTDSITPNITESKSFLPPRILVQWGQGWPCNIYCSNEKAGCVPVAIGQICTYFKSPEQISLTYSDRDQDIQELSWSMINNHLKTSYMLSSLNSNQTIENIHLKSCIATKDAHYAIGRLTRQLGELASSRYTEKDGTLTDEDCAVATLIKVFPNKHFTYGTSAEGLYNLLKDGGVAFSMGTDIGIGHAWVADATGEIETTTIIPVVGSDSNSNYETTVSKYLHYNWGWDGNCNGFFLVGIFATQNAYSYDSSYHTADYNLNNSFEYYYTK